MTACMGGWCSKRAQCPHFYAVFNQSPAERLCLPGRDGERLRHGEIVRIFPNRTPTVDDIKTETEAA